MRLIDADELRKCFEVPHELKCGIQAGMDEYALKCIDEQPTITAPCWHRVEERPKEEGRYWCATKFAGYWIFYAAWYWNNVSDYIGVPVGKEEKADGFVFCEDVVYPDYWMPIEPPNEEA